MNYHLNYNIHGLQLNIKTSDLGFSKYIDNNFAYFRSNKKDPDLSVDFSYYSKFEKNKRRNKNRILTSNALETLGHNMYLQNNSLIYGARGLEINLSYDNRKIKVQATFEEPQRSLRRIINPFALRRDITSYQEQKYSNYHYVSRMAVELPLFLLLELEKNISMLHGSCVEKNGQALIFTGLGGCGKSTLASYLFFKQGYKIMADNYILFRKNEVFCFPKNLRLTPLSMKLLDLTPQEAKAWGKYHYRLNDTHISRTAHANKLFLTSFSPKFQLKQLSSPVAMGYLLSLHDFLQEFPHYTYLAFLPFIAKETLNLIDQRRKNLELFLQNVTSYQLRHSKADPVSNTINAIQ